MNPVISRDLPRRTGVNATTFLEAAVPLPCYPRAERFRVYMSRQTIWQSFLVKAAGS